MWRFILVLAFTLHSIPFYMLSAQAHRYPITGENGVAGTAPNSFLIGWANVPGAIGYEYVVSSNPLCFVGCGGDTRNQYLHDTVAVEYDLVPNKWYYWITRTYFDNEEITEWSSISSFFTDNPEGLSKLVEVASNPISGSSMPLLIDWAINPDATFFQFYLISQNGYVIKGERYQKPVTSPRFEELEIAVEGLPSGLYFLEITVGSGTSSYNHFFTKKVMINH